MEQVLGDALLHTAAHWCNCYRYFCAIFLWRIVGALGVLGVLGLRKTLPCHQQKTSRQYCVSQSAFAPHGKSMTPALVVSELTREIENTPVFKNISFAVNKGEILFIRGPSGVGKSVLLRAIASLDPIQAGLVWIPVWIIITCCSPPHTPHQQGGTVTLDTRTPQQYGIPNWRVLVTYVHQTRVPLKGSPLDLLAAACALTARRDRPPRDLRDLFEQLGLEKDYVDKPWVQLSGGQAQRAYLGVCVALRPDILLLDEPTSACDTGSALRCVGVPQGWLWANQKRMRGTGDMVQGG